MSDATVNTIADVEFGAELPTFTPDTSLETVREFANAVGWGGGGRFHDHEQARKEGLPGALVPGIMMNPASSARSSPTSTKKKAWSSWI